MKGFISDKIKSVWYVIRLVTLLLIMAVCFTIVAWFIVSYLDIVFHNLSSEYEYPDWNLLVTLMEK